MDRATLLRKMNEAMDDVLVEAAASMMRHKLAKARDKGRGGWWNPKECTTKGLREAMDQHAEKGDPVDVMNIAAMVAVREMLETPNVEVQRDSGSIIAGGSAGTTGSAAGDDK